MKTLHTSSVDLLGPSFVLLWSSGYVVGSVATRDIARGDEITNNYRMLDRAFCAAFLKKKKKANGTPNSARRWRPQA